MTGFRINRVRSVEVFSVVTVECGQTRRRQAREFGREKNKLKVLYFSVKRVHFFGE